MGSSSPGLSVVRLGAPPPTPRRAQMIKYVGGRRRRAGKRTPVRGRASRCWTPTPPCQAVVSLAGPQAAAGAGGGARSAERAATQPRKQRAAAAEGRA